MRKNNKIEWSKIFSSLVAVTFGIYGVWCGFRYYKLTELAIANNSSLPSETLAVTCVTVVIASLLSYCLYQGILKTSLNKNKLTIDPKTGIVKSIIKGELSNVIEDIADSLEEETNT